MLKKREDVSLYEERLGIEITGNFDNKHELFDWLLLLQICGEKKFRATSLVNKCEVSGARMSRYEK